MEFNLPPKRQPQSSRAPDPVQKYTYADVEGELETPQDDSLFGTDTITHKNIIKVIGVGGGGGNAVNNMHKQGISGVDFVVANTDVQVLRNSPVPQKLALGRDLTNGLGCGADPAIGQQAAVESMEEIRASLADGTQMVFVTAGMGGGTGTGGAPVIAAMAREMGILTVGIVTTPFKFEGNWRCKIADEGLEELRECVDSLLVINNENLLKVCQPSIKAKEAYQMADNVLGEGARGIAEIITGEGYVNTDFADVRTILKDSGTALMGAATYAGEDRALKAAEAALKNPLLDDVDIHGATGILVNITASEDSFGINEVNTVGEYIQKAAGDQARIIFGQAYDDSMGDELRVTIIACGFERAAQRAERQPQKHSIRNQPNKVEQAALFEEQKEAQDFEDDATHVPEQKPEPKRTILEVEETAQTAPRPRNTERRLEDRRESMRRKEYDFSNPTKREQLEREPAYLRRGMDMELEEDQEVLTRRISRTSVDRDPMGRTSYRDNNAFLFDNVD